MAIVGYVLGGIVLLFVAFISMQIIMVKRMQRQQGKPAPKLSGKPGKIVSKGHPALFYFYSPQCGACRTMTPVVKKMAGSRQGVFPVDISRDMDTARQFGVMATPTTIFVNKGVVQNVLVGAQSETQLRSLFSPA